MPIGRGQENAALWFRYSLPVLKIYNAHNVYYRFPVLEVNIQNIDVETCGGRDTRGIYICYIYAWNIYMRGIYIYVTAKVQKY